MHDSIENAQEHFAGIWPRSAASQWLAAARGTVRASKPFRGSIEHGIYYARSENNVQSFFLSAHLVTVTVFDLHGSAFI